MFYTRQQLAVTIEISVKFLLFAEISMAYILLCLIVGYSKSCRLSIIYPQVIRSL